MYIYREILYVLKYRSVDMNSQFLTCNRLFLEQYLIRQIELNSGQTDELMTSRSAVKPKQISAA